MGYIIFWNYNIYYYNFDNTNQNCTAGSGLYC